MTVCMEENVASEIERGRKDRRKARGRRRDIEMDASKKTGGKWEEEGQDGKSIGRREREIDYRFLPISKC